MRSIIPTILTLLALFTQSAPLAPSLSIDTLLGTWAGEAEHDGETSPVVVQFERRGTDEVRSIVSFPAIHARMGWGTPKLDGQRVQVGPATFDYDPAARTLTTTLPAGLIPRYSMRITLRRSEPFAEPERKRPDAPTRDPLWTLDTGAPIWSDVAFANGVVVVGADDARLHAVEARSGRELWTFKAGGAIRAKAAFVAGDVVVQADDGMLHRLDGKNGRERWRVRIADFPAKRVALADPSSRYENHASAVGSAGNRLYVGTHEGRLLALDAEQGSQVWAFKAGDSIVTTPVVSNGRVFVGSFDHHVYAIDASNGALIWKYDTGDAATSTIAMHGARVIAGSRSYDLESLDAARGTPAWKKYFWFSWVESSPTVFKDVVYIGSSDAAKVFAIDAGSGRSIWEVDAGGSAWGQPAVTETAVYAGVAGVLRYITPHRAALLALDRATGKPLWWFPVKPPEPAPAETTTAYGFAGSVAIGGGLVFAGGLDGRLYAFTQ